MFEFIVFDIETYRPDWRIRRTRREDLDPTKNTMITVGFLGMNGIAIYPTIEDLKEETQVIHFSLEELSESKDSTLLGYNIFHFDIPYIVYKAKSIGKDVDMTQFRPFDLYWILPYWLHNTPNGRTFLNEASHLGNLWSFENVVKHILQKEANPFSNKEIFQLWEMKRFKDIEKHLQHDLIHTNMFFKSSVIQEALNYVQKQSFNKTRCKDNCPFRQQLQKTPYKAVCYCALLRETLSDEQELSAIDVIDQPLPERNISWIPSCLG